MIERLLNTKTLFEMTVAYDIGGAEDGMIVQECTDYFDCNINLSQSESDIFKQVENEYRKEFADEFSGFVGCKVKRRVSEDEAEIIREAAGFYDYLDAGIMY